MSHFVFEDSFDDTYSRKSPLSWANEIDYGNPEFVWDDKVRRSGLKEFRNY